MGKPWRLTLCFCVQRLLAGVTALLIIFDMALVMTLQLGASLDGPNRASWTGFGYAPATVLQQFSASIASFLRLCFSLSSLTDTVISHRAELCG